MLRVLLLYFLSLLGLFRALRSLSPIALTILQLRYLFPKLASIPLTSIYLSSISLASIKLQQIVSQYSFKLYFSSSLTLSYYYFYQPLTRLPSSSIQAQALIQYYSSFTFSTYFTNISSLLQSCWFILLQGTLRSLYSLFRRILIYFITLELRSFYILYIIAASIYSYRGGYQLPS